MKAEKWETVPHTVYCKLISKCTVIGHNLPEASKQPLFRATGVFPVRSGCGSSGLTYVEQLMSFRYFVPSVCASCAPGSDRLKLGAPWAASLVFLLGCFERVKLLAFLKWMRFLAVVHSGKTAEATHSRPGTVRGLLQAEYSAPAPTDVKDLSVCRSGDADETN